MSIDPAQRGSAPDGRSPGPVFPVVGIGASAGGLVAVQTVLQGLPSRSGMAYVIVLHLSTRHESNADSILQRSTDMPVLQVEASVRIQPDHVYVISPKRLLTMVDGCLCVSDRPDTPGPATAIDLFFRAMADAHGAHAIGIVLSGTGSDGTLGLGRIKERGGLTLAQDPEDSDYEGMPRSAIDEGHVDFVLPAADIPARLLALRDVGEAISSPDPSEDDALAADDDEAAASSEALLEVMQLVAAHTGHDFTHYKRATMLRRVERRMQVNLLTDLAAYRDLLQGNAEETTALLADLLISVTQFFRDGDVFGMLARTVVPRLVAEHASGDAIRVWVAGCATGEEAYSIAMLLQDEITRRGSAASFQIFATDIDERAITFARAGSYPESIATDVSGAHLAAYFVHEQGRYRVKRSLRECITFAEHNLLRDAPFSRLDLVTCRNVLIYLERTIQERVLEMFHYALVDQGVLLLGTSESADAGDLLFTPLDEGHRLYRMRATVGVQRQLPALPLRVHGTAARARVPQLSRDLKRSAAELHQRALALHAPPSALLDAEGNIVHLSEQATAYLHHVAGVPTRNLVAVVLPALRMDLRSALLQVAKTRRSVETRHVGVARGERTAWISMLVRPFDDAASASEYILVLFEEVDEALAGGSGAVGDAGMHADVDALARTREQLAATLEFSENSTEQLRATNEELQATNEELRSITEELETSTEELQSVNEELITVNAELKANVEQAGEANESLKNFIAATDIATVFVDRALRIRRFTPPLEGIFRVLPGDVGRSLLDLTHRLDYDALEDDVRHVLDQPERYEREVQGDDGRWFVVRIQPYHDRAGSADGAVLTFIDITSLHLAEFRLSSESDGVRAAMHDTLEFAAVVLDADGVITGWNEGAARIFGYTAQAVIDRPVEVLFTPEDREAKVPARELRIAAKSGLARDDRWMQRADGTRVFCRGVMTALSAPQHGGFVKIVRDATDQEEHARRSEKRVALARARRDDAEATAALKDQFLAVLSHELKHPLNLISVNAEIIARTPGRPLEAFPQAARSLATIARAVQTQSSIIDDLLDLSRIRTGKLSLDIAAVDLVALCASAVDTAAADSASGDRRITLEAAAPSIVVAGDTGRVQQVIWNLLSNAIKFTAPAGRVEVRVSVEPGFGRLDVVDDGQGIDATFLPRVFDMFGQARARAESSASGLGIGLALVRQLVEHHAGRVEVASAGPGEGAHFTVWLPLFAERPSRRRQAPAQSGMRDLTGLRILVVDDDAQSGDALVTLLSLVGARAVSVAGAAEALAALEGGRFDVLVTDLGMPGMDGYALLAKVRENPAWAALPVIALTGFGRPGDVKRARAAGFAAHVAKPVALETLVDRISELTG